MEITDLEKLTVYTHKLNGELYTKCKQFCIFTKENKYCDSCTLNWMLVLMLFIRDCLRLSYIVKKNCFEKLDNF